MDDTRSKSIRYTQAQRLKAMRSRQYSDEMQRTKPVSVSDAEADLSAYNSRASQLSAFCAYCAKRHESLLECLLFYGDICHRHRRWKSKMKEQKSESDLYSRISKIKRDERPIVLAYGSWGLVAGRAGAACNKGNPPCIGVGLMRKLARHFIVSPTPEAYTSKTCCRCYGECAEATDVEFMRGRKIRGLRRCTQRDCMAFLNRDKNGATNIGTNFMRMMRCQPPVRSMTDEDLAFHRASLCMECD